MTDDVYMLPENAWTYITIFIWSACLFLVVLTFAVLPAFDRPLWKRFLVLGAVSTALVVSGLIIEIGPGTVTDSDGLWACPTGVQAVQIESIPGRPLPGAVEECKRIGMRNLVIGSAMSGAGTLLAIGSIATQIIRKQMRA